MSVSLLNLHLSQVSRALRRAQANNYSNKAQENYQQLLGLLFENILSNVRSNEKLAETFHRYQDELRFISKSLEFLDDSTINLIPFELVECLETALRDWLRPEEQYIIVTSLVNRYAAFSFDPYLVRNSAIYQYIEEKYKIAFQQRLVQINIPRTLSRDYLACVINYHELGHFIDMRFSIVDPIVDELRQEYRTGSGKTPGAELLSYFPMLTSGGAENTQSLLAHAREYFADVFAAQYVADTPIRFLDYLTTGNDRSSATHPSAASRRKLVSAFLLGKQHPVLDLYTSALNRMGLPALGIRYELPTDADMLRLLPTNLASQRQAHGILVMAWDIWENKMETFAKAMGADPITQYKRVLVALNNLVEKSLGNYTIVSRWKS